MDKIFEIKDLDHFEKIINDILVKLHFPKEDVSVDLLSDSLEHAMSELKNLLLSNDFNTDKISNILENKQWADKHKIDIFVSAVKERKNDLIFRSVLEHNSLSGEVMIDFDWCLKLILGTSQLKMLNYPILQLSMSTIEANNLYRNTTYEIKKDILLKLICLLESVE